MVNIVIAYVLGVASAIIFYPLINSGLNKLFKKND